MGSRCHELRITDQSRQWRVVYRVDPDAIVIASVFEKTTRQTPKREIELAQNRLADYDRI